MQILYIGSYSACLSSTVVKLLTNIHSFAACIYQINSKRLFFLFIKFLLGDISTVWDGMIRHTFVFSFLKTKKIKLYTVICKVHHITNLRQQLVSWHGMYLQEHKYSSIIQYFGVLLFFFLHIRACFFPQRRVC